MDFFGFLSGFLTVFCLGGIFVSPVTLRQISRQYSKYLGEYNGPVWFERMILLVGLAGMFALVGILVSVSHGSTRSPSFGIACGTFWDILVRLRRWRAQRTPLAASESPETGATDIPASAPSDTVGE